MQYINAIEQMKPFSIFSAMRDSKARIMKTEQLLQHLKQHLMFIDQLYSFKLLKISFYFIEESRL